jgi:hypothetical protein
MNELLIHTTRVGVLDIHLVHASTRWSTQVRHLPHIGGYTTNQRLQNNKTNRKKSILLRQTRYQAQGKHYYYYFSFGKGKGKGKGKELFDSYLGANLFFWPMWTLFIIWSTFTSGGEVLELVPFLGG